MRCNSERARESKRGVTGEGGGERGIVGREKNGG